MSVQIIDREAFHWGLLKPKLLGQLIIDEIYFWICLAFSIEQFLSLSIEHLPEEGDNVIGDDISRSHTRDLANQIQPFLRHRTVEQQIRNHWPVGECAVRSAQQLKGEFPIQTWPYLRPGRQAWDPDLFAAPEEQWIFETFPHHRTMERTIQIYSSKESRVFQHTGSGCCAAQGMSEKAYSLVAEVETFLEFVEDEGGVGGS
jgi:hypothetical protein